MRPEENMKADAIDCGVGCSGLQHAMRRSEIYITRALRNAIIPPAHSLPPAN
jgi:hypothetical protein